MALNSYSKTLWVNNTAPARNETNLNKQEQGIYDVTEETITNTSAIGILNDRVDGIPHDYYYNKTIGFVVPAETFVEAGRLTQVITAGTWEIKFSFTFDYNVSGKSAFFRFSIDGGATWTEEFRREIKYGTDHVPIYYSYPSVLLDGQIDIIFQARKEAAGDMMNISFLDIILDKKLN